MNNISNAFILNDTAKKDAAVQLATEADYKEALADFINGL